MVTETINGLRSLEGIHHPLKGRFDLEDVLTGLDDEQVDATHQGKALSLLAIRLLPWVSKSMWPRVGNLVVGPIEPATKQGFGIGAVLIGHTPANSAARRLSSKACSSSPYSASTTLAAPNVGLNDIARIQEETVQRSAVSGRVTTRFSLRPRVPRHQNQRRSNSAAGATSVAPSNTSTGRSGNEDGRKRDVVGAIVLPASGVRSRPILKSRISRSAQYG